MDFTNVKKLKTDGKRPKVWSVTNLDFSYSYTQIKKHDPLIESDDMRRTRGAITYNFAPEERFIEPFKKLIKSKSPWLALVSDFNFNYKHSQISVKADIFRQFGALQVRNVGGGPFKIPETYDKYFTFDRFYILQWNLTRSISLDYSATNNARIDEPYGRIDTKAEKDTVRKNFFKGGRNTQYHQDVTLAYNVPTSKIPILSWTTLRATYSTRYNWLAASLLSRSLGNTLSNTQTKNINGELKFDDLYNKWKFLRAVYSDEPRSKDSGNPSPGNNNKENKKEGDKGNIKGNDKGNVINDDKGNAINDVKGNVINDSKGNVKGEAKANTKGEVKSGLQNSTDTSGKKKKPAKIKDPNKLPYIAGVPKFFLRLATSLKKIGIQYTEDYGTTLPGYLDCNQFLLLLIV